MSVNSLVYRLELQEMFAFFFENSIHTRSESYLPVLKSLSVIRSFVLSVVIFRKLSTAAYNAELIK